MKENLLFISAFILALNSLCSNAEAQEKVKFGHIPIEDLQMDRYDADTTAPAVILYDKGHFNARTSHFTRHVRLKILRKAGTSYANFHIRTAARSNIDGSTYNLENGQMIEASLEKENIFKEEIVEGVYTYKIFFPSVKPGSVVELRYSFLGLPYEWRFQDGVPVKYNELLLEPTRYIVFKKTMFGRHPIKTDDYRWIATDVPALLEEPYMCHYSNYLTHFKIDIESVGIPGYSYMEFSSSWETIGKRLSEATYFGDVLTNTPFLNEKAHEIKGSKASTLKKIQAAYSYIQENIKWNGFASEYATREFWTNFKKNHSGNSAEVNLMLVSLLQKSGINTYAAVLSTRDHGLLNPLSASMTGLNYVIAYVKTDSLQLLLDATEPELVPGVLPARCRNISAFVVDAPGGFWLDTSDGKSHSRKHFVSIEPDKEGRLRATVSHTYEDYDYLEWMKGFKDKGSEEAYIRSVIANSTDVNIRDCKLSIEKDKLKASEIRTVDLAGTEYVQDLGNEKLVNPFLFWDIVNPFKEEMRQYPVDFIYPRKRSIIVSFKLPENQSLRSIPEPLAITLENGGAQFTYRASVTRNILTIACHLHIEKQIFSPDEYSALRHFFIEVTRKMAEPLQLDEKT
jgi:hypothetical protein